MANPSRGEARRREEEESESPGSAAQTEERNKNIGENRENILNENTSQRFIIQITLHSTSPAIKEAEMCSFFCL